MLVVKVELHSAVDGSVVEIGRANISNDGTGTHDVGNYLVDVFEYNGKYKGYKTGKSTHKRYGAPAMEMVASCISSVMGKKA